MNIKVIILFTCLVWILHDVDALLLKKLKGLKGICKISDRENENYGPWRAEKDIGKLLEEQLESQKAEIAYNMGERYQNNEVYIVAISKILSRKFAEKKVLVEYIPGRHYWEETETQITIPELSAVKNLITRYQVDFTWLDLDYSIFGSDWDTRAKYNKMIEHSDTLLLFDCKNAESADLVYSEMHSSEMDHINEVRQYCTENERHHLDNLNLISNKLLYCSELLDKIINLESKTADKIFQLAEQGKYSKTMAGKCLSTKFENRQVRFGDEPKSRNAHEKYIFDDGTAYYIPDMYDVGVKLINEDTYNIQITSMFLDFAKFVNKDIPENRVKRNDIRYYISDCKALERFEPKNSEFMDKIHMKSAVKNGVTLIGYKLEEDKKPIPSAVPSRII